MELTKEWFEDFRTRLIYDHKGKGVEYHYTNNPIFIVQTLKRDYGYDEDYCDNHDWMLCDGDYILAGETTFRRLDLLHENGRDTKGWTKICYHERWEYVSAHLTKEAADKYIEVQKHNHDGLRIYVDSQYRCHEWNVLIEGLLKGNIVFKEC